MTKTWHGFKVLQYVKVTTIKRLDHKRPHGGVVGVLNCCIFLFSEILAYCNNYFQNMTLFLFCLASRRAVLPTNQKAENLHILHKIKQMTVIFN